MWEVRTFVYHMFVRRQTFALHKFMKREMRDLIVLLDKCGVDMQKNFVGSLKCIGANSIDVDECPLARQSYQCSGLALLCTLAFFMQRRRVREERQRCRLM